jgi:asparagine synthase (glutamine-hydrolysing)
MCGIAVAIGWDGAEAVVRRLIAGMLHRGDVTDPLCTVRSGTAMCTRRLRIVDAANGAQPHASFDRRFLVCFNGEIYNHVEVRRAARILRIFRHDEGRAVFDPGAGREDGREPCSAPAAAASIMMPRAA